jgi:hypothetical protein
MTRGAAEAVTDETGGQVEGISLSIIKQALNRLDLPNNRDVTHTGEGRRLCSLNHSRGQSSFALGQHDVITVGFDFFGLTCFRATACEDRFWLDACRQFVVFTAICFESCLDVLLGIVFAFE